MNGEMPKMPQPNGYIVGLQWIRHEKTARSLSDDPLEVYTADQMRAYAQEATRQVMERDAEVCDKEADRLYDMHLSNDDSVYWLDKSESARDCADAIRALSDMPAQEKTK